MNRYHTFQEIKYKTLMIFLILLIMFSIPTYAQIQTDVPHLKDVYKNDFYFGCLLSYAHIGFPTDPPVPGQSNVVDPNGGYLIQFHMNSMGPGNWMKSAYIVDINGSASAYNLAGTQIEKDSIDVHPIITFNGNIIAQLNWAQRQGFTFRGHTLVWHNQTPGTAFFRSGYTSNGTRLSKEKMTQRMENFIKEVIRIIHESWPGLLSAFDVVNEAVNDNGTDRTASEWYETFGDNSYIMKAFEFARNYTILYNETQIKLYYNDYNTSNPQKADGIVRICGPIFQAGFLDGIGMQEHDQLVSPTADQWITSYNKFDTICTEMSVTELDVNPGSGTPTPSVLQTQANQFAMLFKCFMDRSYRSGRGKIVSVTKDGLNDQWTFIANSSLWDSNDQCKPAFYAVADVGINYNMLDSLIAFADSLNEEDYTPQSWSDFIEALTSGVNAIEQNYTNSISAADALGEAKDNLQAAIDGLVLITTDVDDIASKSPKVFLLNQNYPNPFNPTTQISYSIPQNGYISLKVYDLLGMEIATLFEGILLAGNYVVSFDGSEIASGIYLYRLKANNFIETKKLILLK